MSWNGNRIGWWEQILNPSQRALIGQIADLSRQEEIKILLVDSDTGTLRTWSYHQNVYGLEALAQGMEQIAGRPRSGPFDLAKHEFTNQYDPNDIIDA